MSRFHPASASYHTAGICQHHVISSIPIIGPLLSPSTPKAAALPAPVPTPTITPAPTVDQAATEVQQQENNTNQNESNAGKGALSTLLNTSSGASGDDLGASSQESTLKRFLGS